MTYARLPLPEQSGPLRRQATGRPRPHVPSRDAVFALQRAVGNRATAQALRGRDHVVQRMPEDVYTAYFTGKNDQEAWKNNADFVFLYPKSATNRAKRWKRLGEVAASGEQLTTLIDSIGAENLFEFVGKVSVRVLSKTRPGTVFAVVNSTQQLDPGKDLQLRLECLFYFAAERNLDLEGLRTLDTETKSGSGADLDKARVAAEEEKAARAEAARVAAEREAIAKDSAAALSKRTRLIIDPANVVWLLGRDGGEQLWQLASEIAARELLIRPEGVAEILQRMFDNKDEYQGRLRGALDEFTQAHERLDRQHIIQMGKMPIEEAVTRILGLSLDVGHPSYGVQQYVHSNQNVFVRENKSIGADIIDWTGYAVLQLKSTQGVVRQTVVDHIVKAIDQVRGWHGETPLKGQRWHQQARVTLDNDALDPARLMADEAVVAKAVPGSALSVAIITHSESFYFVPFKSSGKGWRQSKTDPTTEQL